MAYTPTNWECGDVVTAEALNKIENGIANASGGGNEIVVIRAASISEDGNNIIITTDKTWQEIFDALTDGIPCYVGFNNAACTASDVSELNRANMSPLVNVDYDGVDYCAYFINNGIGETIHFDTLTAHGATTSGYLEQAVACSSN